MVRVTAEPPPLTADDRLALYEMAARYARAQDLLDVEAYLSNLTPDARVTDTRGREFVGHAALRSRFEHRGELYPEPRQHFIGQPWIEGNSARCVMHMYWIVILRRPDDTRVLKQFGEYIDTCVKIDGRWMVEDRRIEDWPT
jgi:SnoaL-like domain